MGVIMGNIIAIYRRELQSYFASPFAYTIAGFFWLLTGFFFVSILFGVIQSAAFLDQSGNPSQSFDLPYEFLQIFMGNLAVISLFILPMLSMGLYTEERKRGTLELLATSPITNWAVAVGKLLGVITFYITMLLPLLALEMFALSASNPPFSPGILLLAHGGLILMAAAVLSLGMFISSLTDSTILSAILTFVFVIILWVLDDVASKLGGGFGDAVGYLSLLKNYSNLVKGIIDTSNLLVFSSYIFLGIFLTALSIDAFRFQRSS